MAMISILSFWLVIALSSLEHCERGRREKKAYGPLEGENDNKVRVRQNKTNEQEKITAAQEYSGEKKTVSLFVSFQF